ncbi:hypothetical protein AYK24_04070 [Thermoplasmatales archaeon SG8-52-4]|nr:MAG: hypothetical protein AYK24_04070 [Thermoplasmatales archaeon SG8-52-4]
MKKIIDKKSILTLIVVVLFFLPSTILTSGYNKINEEIKVNNEEIFYRYINNEEIQINFNLKGLSEEKINTKLGDFTVFNIPNSGFIGNLGKPLLPVKTFLFAVPTLDVSLDVINYHIERTDIVGKVYPAQKPQTDNNYDVDEFTIDEKFYQMDVNYPGKLGEIVNSGKIRDIYFIKVELYPVNYNPKKEIVTIYDEITISLSWDTGQTVSVESDFSHSSFTNFYNNIFPNWQGYLDNTLILESGNGFREDGCNYLIITHPDFYSEILDLANWKHSKGYQVKLVDTNITGDTSNEIKTYIQNAYDTWDPRPSYLLLVGDSEFIPTSSSGTDLYYATVDGSDYFPDMYHGRIPADTAQEAEIIVQKILNYEKNPPSLASFYNNFTVAAYFQDDEQNGYETRRFVRTSEEVRDYLMTLGYEGERIYCTESYINPTHYNNDYYGNGEPLPEELLRPNFAWDGDAEDIINAVENGVFILNHRDHGFEDGWGDPYFDTSHVEELTNGDLTPVVFSINCLTGRFDNYECFSEEFLRKEGGGAVAVFGATRVSYSGYNDYLCRGFYDAQWPEFDTEIGDNDTSLYTLGEIMNYGKVFMTQTWGDPWGYEDYTFELFHIFGDPTMEIWTSIPKTLEVSYSSVGDYLEVEVTGDEGPVEGALVCISQDSGFYAKGYTGSSGTINLDISSAIIEEEVDFVASFHNYLTYTETFFLNQAPEIPDKPSGPNKGKPNEELTFSSSTTDADGDQIYYMWRWGDGDYSEWLGPYNSGDTVDASHSWVTTSNYQVRVKAKDIFDQETDWSESFIVSITKTKTQNLLYNRFLESLLDLFPLIKLFF